MISICSKLITCWILELRGPRKRVKSVSSTVDVSSIIIYEKSYALLTSVGGLALLLLEGGGPLDADVNGGILDICF